MIHTLHPKRTRPFALLCCLFIAFLLVAWPTVLLVEASSEPVDFNNQQYMPQNTNVGVSPYISAESQAHKAMAETTPDIGYSFASQSMLLEAEEGVFTPGWIQTWTVLTDQHGIHVQALPDMHIIMSSEDALAGGSPTIEFDLGVTAPDEAGEYTVWVYGLAPNYYTDGDNYFLSGLGETVYVSLDGQLEATMAGFSQQTWQWTKLNAADGSDVTITRHSGQAHTLALHMREDGLSIDKILLTKVQQPPSILLEAEESLITSDSTHTWTILSGSHKQYVQALPDNKLVIPPELVTYSPAMHFDLGFTAPDQLTQYTVWVYGSATSRQIDSDSYYLGGLGETVYVSLNDSLQATLGGFQEEWAWTKLDADDGSDIIVTLTPGQAHTLTLHMREDGLSIDKILLTQDPTYIPNGDYLPSESLPSIPLGPDAWTATGMVIPTDTQTVDRFGYALDMDENFLIVGAYQGDVSIHGRAGYVDIYQQNNGQWSWLQRLDQSSTPDARSSANYYGHAVALDGNRLAIGSTRVRRNGSNMDVGAVYLYRLQDGIWVYDASIGADDGADEDYFGIDIALDGDRLLVGAYFDDDNGISSGSAYIFDYDAWGNRKWTQTTKLTAPAADANPYDYYGFRVALQDDTAVVGAYLSDYSSVNGGVVYVYTFDGTSWHEQNTLSAPTAHDHFGHGVAIYSNTLAVGAPNDDTQAANAGAVYLFDLGQTGSSPTYTQKIVAFEGKHDANFGIDVAFESSEKVQKDLLVGAYRAAASDFNSGAVYRFEDDGTNWQQVAQYGASYNEKIGYRVAGTDELTSGGANYHVDGLPTFGVYLYDDVGNAIGIAPGLSLNAVGRYGHTVDIQGDMMAVGAFFADLEGADSPGYVDLYQLQNEAWVHQQRLTQSDTPDPRTTYDYFGKTVSFSDNRLAIGSYRAQVDGSNIGAVYIFAPEGNEWVYSSTATASDPADEQYFGNDVVLDGDRLIVGAHRDDDLGTEAGAAYIFDWDGTGWQEQTKLTADNGQAGDKFGLAVGLDGNVAVVGAYTHDTPSTNAGAAYVYRFNGLTWTLEETLQAPTPTAGDYFGYDVDTIGETIVVGAYADDEGGSNTGSVFVFNYTDVGASNGYWSQTAQLNASDPQSSDYFGMGVALSNDGREMLVGARGNDDRATNGGAVYHFGLIDGLWQELSKLSPEQLTHSAYLGQSNGMALDGTLLAIGAEYQETPSGFSGAVFAYERDPVGVWEGWLQLATDNAPNVWGEYALAYDDVSHHTLLYGGNADGWPYEETLWQFDGTEWQELAVTQVPSAVYGMDMAVLSGTVVLFGGSNAQDIPLADTWLFDGTDWQQHAPSATPSARTGAVLATNHSDQMWLFGGQANTLYFNDLWRYEALTASWQLITTTTAPTPRSHASMIYADDTLWLFGGRVADGSFRNDLWQFDIATGEWNEVPLTGSWPEARMAHSLSHDPDNDILLLFGGRAADNDIGLTDTWVYELSSGIWQEITTTVTPEAGTHHTMVYDPFHRYALLFTNGQTWLYKSQPE